MAFVDPLPSNTITAFKGSTAITGWSKVVAYNDYALRVTSGATGGSTGGSVGFTTVFGATITPSGSFSVALNPTTSATALTAPQLPIHNHGPFMKNPFPTPTASLSSIYTNTVPGWYFLVATSLAVTYMSTPGPAAPYTFGGPGGQNPIGATSTGHTHTMTSPSPGTYTGNSLNFQLRYVDVILCRKD